MEFFDESTENKNIKYQPGTLIAYLLKGPIYRTSSPQIFYAIDFLKESVTKFARELGLNLIFSDEDGYAFLKSIEDEEYEQMYEDFDLTTRPPKFMSRIQLPLFTSYLIILLRKKLIELDTDDGIDNNRILSKDELLELMKTGMPVKNNESKIDDNILKAIDKVCELGFLRKLENPNNPSIINYEIMLIIKGIIDSQFLSDLDSKLESYTQAISDKYQ
jgi:hypothetical protein